MRNKSQYAYTLIEVLVALTILGLIFSFGFVGFRDFSRRQHLGSVASDIKGDLRLVQSKALSGEKPDGANCSGNSVLVSYSFSLISTSDYQIIANCSAGNVIIKTVTVSPDVSMSSSQSPISFKVIGNGTNVEDGSDAVITISQPDSGLTTTITITYGGEIK